MNKKRQPLKTGLIRNAASLLLGDFQTSGLVCTRRIRNLNVVEQFLNGKFCLGDDG